jgi:hypothetical protein
MPEPLIRAGAVVARNPGRGATDLARGVRVILAVARWPPTEEALAFATDIQRHVSRIKGGMPYRSAVLLAFFRVARSFLPLVLILPLARLRRLLHGRRTGSCLDLVSVVGRVHMQP